MTREEVIRILKLSIENSRNHVRFCFDNKGITALDMAIQALEQTQWIPCSERLPKTDNKNDINSFNVLLWVKNKTHPEKEAQIYLGKLMHVDGDDGSGNLWGIKTEPCEWTIWGWSYFNEPEVIAWMPLPKPYLSDINDGKMSENPTGSKDVIWYSKRNYSEIVVEPQESEE